jgi:uncharacterized protein (TIGR02246 family)
MRLVRTVVASALLAGGVLAAVYAAQDKPAQPAAEPTPDEAAVRATAQALVKAFAAGDAKAVAAFWTEQGEYVDADGPPVRGRASLEKAYTDFFAKRQPITIEGKTDSVRFLGKDTAVEEGTFTVRAKDAPADTSRYSTLYVRQDGKWLIALLKEWSDEDATADLQDLAWLVGTWEADGPDTKARTTYDWVDGKAFLRCRYTVTLKKDNTTSTGTQIIGVDPATSQIRSWTFDSAGGIGEGDWSWDGEKWSIDSTGTLPDGTTTTALNFLTRSGDNAFSWRSVRRTSDGDPQPDIPVVKVTRVKEAK